MRKESYFDSMTHYDFKCLLPSLLHVEDRVSMAHGPKKTWILSKILWRSMLVFGRK